MRRGDVSSCRGQGRGVQGRGVQRRGGQSHGPQGLSNGGGWRGSRTNCTPPLCPDSAIQSRWLPIGHTGHPLTATPPCFFPGPSPSLARQLCERCTPMPGQCRPATVPSAALRTGSVDESTQNTQLGGQGTAVHAGNATRTKVAEGRVERTFQRQQRDGPTGNREVYFIPDTKNLMQMHPTHLPEQMG